MTNQIENLNVIFSQFVPAMAILSAIMALVGAVSLGIALRRKEKDFIRSKITLTIAPIVVTSLLVFMLDFSGGFDVNGLIEEQSFFVRNILELAHFIGNSIGGAIMAGVIALVFAGFFTSLGGAFLLGFFIGGSSNN